MYCIVCIVLYCIVCIVCLKMYCFFMHCNWIYILTFILFLLIFSISIYIHLLSILLIITNIFPIRPVGPPPKSLALTSPEASRSYVREGLHWFRLWRPMKRKNFINLLKYSFGLLSDRKKKEDISWTFRDVKWARREWFGMKVGHVYHTDERRRRGINFELSRSDPPSCLLRFVKKKESFLSSKMNQTP